MAAARECSGGNRRWAIAAASSRAVFSTKLETRRRSFPSLTNIPGRHRERTANDFYPALKFEFKSDRQLRRKSTTMGKNISVSLLALLLAASPLLAEVKLASPFTSHMVLQRDMNVP